MQIGAVFAWKSCFHLQTVLLYVSQSLGFGTKLYILYIYPENIIGSLI